MNQSPDLLASETLNRSACIRIALLIDEGGLTGRTIRQMAAKAGGFKALMGLSEKTFLEMVGGSQERINRLLKLLHHGRILERLDKAEETCERDQIQTIICTDPDYPDRLKRISSYPTVLFWRGRPMPSVMNEPMMVTIVGTRRPTGYGRIMTERIASALAQAGLVIVSGLARGVDTMAHQAALAAGRPTIGILACGVDLAYPPENAGLIARMCETGIVMSEHIPGTPPIPSYFPARNRLLSGLSDAVIVTEASMKSGSMITATFAADQGRDVYAVPGNVLSHESEGCNHLIREGAYLLSSAEDVLWRLPAGQRMDALSAALRGNDSIDISEEICQTLAGGPLTIDDLAAMMNLRIPEMLCFLSDLEIRNQVHRERGRYILTV